MRGKYGCLLAGALVTASLAVVGSVTGIVVAVVPFAFALVLLAVAWQFDELDGHIGGHGGPPLAE